MKCKTVAPFFHFCFVPLAILAIILNSALVIMADAELKVGGKAGWRQPGANETEMYSEWAAARRFRVGNSLCFEYKNDSVFVVDKWGYYHCNASHPISVYKDGNTTINLEKPGPMYFVSGDPEHCKNGQRLLVEVMSLHQESPSPPSSGSASSFVFSNSLFFYMILTTASWIASFVYL